MKISYAITVCNELEEIQKLIPHLLEYKRDEDEIVVLQDESKPGEKTVAVQNYLNDFLFQDKIKLNSSFLNGDFASFKNELFDLCDGDFIFQIDADEIPNSTLIKYLPEILELNNIDLYAVPRINTVDNIGLSHVKKWGWNISKLESMIEEKEFDLDIAQDRDEYELLKECGLIIEENKIP